MSLPGPILSFFAHILSKDSPGACQPGNELVSQLAVSCGSYEEAVRVAQALRDSGVLRAVGSTTGAGSPFDSAAVYDVVVPEPLPTTTSVNPPVTPSPALGRSSLSLSLTRSTSRDTDGATTSSGIVRLLKTSAKAVQGFPRQSRDGPDEIPASANLVAALVQVRLHVHLAPLCVDNSSCAMQAPLSVSVSVPKATRILRDQHVRYAHSYTCAACSRVPT